MARRGRGGAYVLALAQNVQRAIGLSRALTLGQRACLVLNRLLRDGGRLPAAEAFREMCADARLPPDVHAAMFSRFSRVRGDRTRRRTLRRMRAAVVSSVRARFCRAAAEVAWGEAERRRLGRVIAGAVVRPPAIGHPLDGDRGAGATVSVLLNVTVPFLLLLSAPTADGAAINEALDGAEACLSALSA